MKDAIGGTIREGHLLYWLKISAPVKVVGVSEGGLSIGNSKEVTPPKLMVELEIGINLPPNAPPGFEPMLSEFLHVVDPKQEALLDKIMGGTKQ